jgi:hypothetical protein
MQGNSRIRIFITVAGIHLLCLVFTLFMALNAKYGFASDAGLFCERQVRQLQAELSQTIELSQIHVEFIDRKITGVCIDGTVKTQKDFGALRRKLLERPWRGLDDFWWDVTIQENNTTIDGFDHELFGDSEM